MEKRIKITNLSDIYDGTKLIIRDFSNLDLEGLDLSVIPPECFEGCTFYNTNFKNTKIRFKPGRLENCHGEGIFESPVLIENCDFRGNDLSFIDSWEDIICIHSRGWPFIGLVTFKNCDLRDTKSSFICNFLNTFLDDRQINTDSRNFNGTVEIDIDTLEKNPKLNLYSSKIMDIITGRIYKYRDSSSINSLIENFEKLSKLDVKCYISEKEKLLKYDKRGLLKKLYDKLNLSLLDEYLFFHGYIFNKCFNSFIFDDNLTEALNAFNFIKCDFSGAVFDSKFPALAEIQSDVFDVSSKYENIYLPHVNQDAWRLFAKKERVSSSPITFRTNLYVELDRSCNGKCVFCRNKSFNDSNYRFENIVKTVNQTIPFSDSVVIGGGEPTLRINDVKKLYELSTEKTKWVLFTNGSMKNMIDKLPDEFYYNVSRHSFDDKNNARILGLSELDIMNTRELNELCNKREVTICATCFKGGLDSTEKLSSYIDYGCNVGAKNIIISDLQHDCSVGILNGLYKENINVNDNLFKLVIDELVNNGYEKGLPIWSTGGYVLIVLKRMHSPTITFKHYVTRKELENNFICAIKRNFDLSIDPSGRLFENWHQTSGLVKKISKVPKRYKYF